MSFNCVRAIITLSCRLGATCRMWHGACLYAWLTCTKRCSLGGHTRTYVCVCTSVCICSFRDKPHFVHVKHTPPCMIQNAAWGLQGGLQPWLIAGAWQCTRHACALSKCCMTCCMMTLCVRVPVCTHRSRQHRSAALWRWVTWGWHRQTPRTPWCWWKLGRTFAWRAAPCQVCPGARACLKSCRACSMRRVGMFRAQIVAQAALQRCSGTGSTTAVQRHRQHCSGAAGEACLYALNGCPGGVPWMRALNVCPECVPWVCALNVCPECVPSGGVLWRLSAAGGGWQPWSGALLAHALKAAKECSTCSGLLLKHEASGQGAGPRPLMFSASLSGGHAAHPLPCPEVRLLPFSNSRGSSACLSAAVPANSASTSERCCARNPACKRCQWIQASNWCAAVRSTQL